MEITNLCGKADVLTLCQQPVHRNLIFTPQMAVDAKQMQVLPRGASNPCC